MKSQSFAVPLARSLVTSFAVLAFVVPAAMAENMTAGTTEYERNILRGVIYYSYPTGEQAAPVTVLYPDGPVSFPNARFMAKDAPGVTFSYERKLMRFLGLSFGVSCVRYDFEATLDRTETVRIYTRIGTQTVVPITGTVLWHPLKRRFIDWYVGAGYAYVMYRDWRTKYVQGPETYESGSDRGFVAQTGFDAILGGRKHSGVPHRLRWAINLDLRYMHTRSTGNPILSKGIDINPVDISLGTSARF